MEPDRNKVFVGGIPWEANEDSLKGYFNGFGEVVDVTIMKDKATGRARGFGFVAFADAAVAEKVINEKHSIDGRTVDVKKAVRKEESQIHSRSQSDDAIPASRTSTKKIFVGGLASTVTEDDLKQYFEQFGTITDVVVMYDQSTQRPRGFGFITFETEDAVEQALHERLHELNGKKVEVKKAIPKEFSSSRQGFGPGRRACFGVAYGHSSNSSPSPGYASSPYAPSPVARGFFAPYGPPAFASPPYGPSGMGYGNAMNGGFGGPAYRGSGYPSGPYPVGYGGGPAATYVGVPAGYGTPGASMSPAGVRSPWSHPGSGYACGGEANAHGNASWRPGSAAGQATHTATGYNSWAYDVGYNFGMSDAGCGSNVAGGYPARNATDGTGSYGDVYPESNPYQQVGDAQRSGESRGSPGVLSPSSSTAVTDPVGYTVAGRQPQRGPDARFRLYPASNNQVT